MRRWSTVSYPWVAEAKTGPQQQAVEAQVEDVVQPRFEPSQPVHDRLVGATERRVAGDGPDRAPTAPRG